MQEEAALFSGSWTLEKFGIYIDLIILISLMSPEMEIIARNDGSQILSFY